MENRQTKERGILKSERQRVTIESPPRIQLTPQGSLERALASPQPSVDRLSVTWAEPQQSMDASGANLFNLQSETPINNEAKFSPHTGEGSEDEDYSASLSAVLRQRRASVRRSRIGRGRRPSSPFFQERRRSSVFTTSSGDTAISIDDAQAALVTQEEIFENIHLHKEVLGSVKQQPLGMRRKLKIVHQAKAYIKRHQGQLQERLAQSKNTRDIYARFSIVINAKWQQMNREAANLSNVLIPWESRIKEIESHFGSVVASYFTFLRWLFWVNLVIGFVLTVFVIIPEYLTANKEQDGDRKSISDKDWRNATSFLTLWEFDGILKVSPIFYGYYTNISREYRMPLAYFLTGLTVYIYSFVATLRKMAENSRMSKLSEKDDECIFSWKLFTGWDFMIGNAETAHNRIASIILGFKEALLEEAEKKKNLRNWRILTLRALVNICVVILLIASAYAVVTVVSRSDEDINEWKWWHDNQTTIVVTVISIMFPVFFELLGYLEHYHPRKQLRLQLARIMLLNLLNLYSLIFALFSKIEGMSIDLSRLQPPLPNSTITINNTFNVIELSQINIPIICIEEFVPCEDEIQYFSNYKECKGIELTPSLAALEPNLQRTEIEESKIVVFNVTQDQPPILTAENLIQQSDDTRTIKKIVNTLREELTRLRSYGKIYNGIDSEASEDTFSSTDYADYSLETITSNKYTTSEYTNDGIITEDPTAEVILNTSITDRYDTTILLTEEFIINNTKNTEEQDSYNTSVYDFPTEFSTLFQGSSSTFSLQDQDFSTIDHTQSNINEEHLSSPSPTILSSTEENSAATEILNKALVVTKYMCPDLYLNYTEPYNNITRAIHIANCTEVSSKCYKKICRPEKHSQNITNSNITSEMDIAYIDSNNRKAYNLTSSTKNKLEKLCWETMFGQELVKLTMMDLVFVLLGTLFMDFFRSIFVRYMNKCWCWNLEKKFPEYGDFKIAENILHLINNQGMVWMGMFFSPGLVVLNVFKLIIMMYLRSWAVMTCNIPHEVVFRVSKSNNFYLALLLTMLFLCVLPVGYSIVWIKPSWHCGPFSEYDKIYHILTINIYKILPKNLNFALEYMTSPAIVIPLLVLLILIIYYLTSLTNSLREANNDLKIQLRRERTEERRKMFQLADKRRRTGSSALENTPFARWRKALPSLVVSKSIDSYENKTAADEPHTTKKQSKRKNGIFAKIVAMALDKKSNGALDKENLSTSPNIEDDPDTEFHENLPSEMLKIKDIQVNKAKNRKTIETLVSIDTVKPSKERYHINDDYKSNYRVNQTNEITQLHIARDTHPSLQQEDGSYLTTTNIPLITISHTESDDEILQENNKKKIKNNEDINCGARDQNKAVTDHKLLQRQSSVDSSKSDKLTNSFM